MRYESLEAIVQDANARGREFWEVIMEKESKQSQVPQEKVFEKMTQMLGAMRLADESYRSDLRSSSGLSGGDGGKMESYVKTGQNLCGSFGGRVMTRALRMSENNACMKRIVAAPTAGAGGVLPAVLLTYQEEHNTSEEELVKALFVAGGIGDVISIRASISGAKGGCQAEIGSSSAMAAGALVALQGGSIEALTHAAGLALKNMLGLVCDPVAGLVEIPCIKRNAMGAMNALLAADLAMAGIRSAIPADEVIDTMREIGNVMNEDLKETGRGGLAQTPTGRAILERLQ